MTDNTFIIIKSVTLVMTSVFMLITRVDILLKVLCRLMIPLASATSIRFTTFTIASTLIRPAWHTAAGGDREGATAAAAGGG